MRSEVVDAINSGARIIFVDEAVFSPATMLKRSWSNKNSSIRIKDVRNKIKT